MKFEVYDKKNPDRKLGTIEADPRAPGVKTYAVPLMSVPSAVHFASYDPDEAPDVRTIYFDIDWRYEVTEDPSPSKWVRNIRRREWAVMLTDAPIETLMKIDGFRIDGWDSLRDRIYRGRI